MRIAPEFRPIVRQLQKRGFRVVDGKRHVHLLTPEGDFVSAVPTKTGCPRALKNWRAQLRKHGIEV